MKISSVLIRPIITEKSTRLTENDKFAFEVALKASKGAVAKDVENLYKVDVISVATIIVPGKQKRVPGKREYTKLSKWKKAVVTLKKGQKISLFEVKE